ncbi:MAG: hypothetical protein QNJ20_02545 [Paracoccaceae bacterium]|nr:hypothetical protein [Paracoccaceae bacterium]
MKGTHVAALCGVLVLATGCATKAPITSRALIVGSTIKGMPYYLPKSYLRVSFDAGASPVTAAEVVNIPDQSRGYSAEVGFSAFSNDLFVIQTSQDGLLETVSVDTEEQSDVIVQTLTSRVSDILAGEEFRSFNREASVQAFSILIDPFDPQLSGHGMSLGNGAFVRNIGDALVSDGPAVACPADAAICVPLLVPVKIELSVAGQIFQHFVTVAHPHHVMGIRIDRHACVRSKSVLTLQAGVITKFDVDKPSEVAGCLSIPLDVISAIVAAPVNALTGRKKRLDAERELLDGQRLLLEQQQELLAAQIAAAETE